ncbi:hypothetical protein [Peribacillus sp. NPDC096540]|uniref:hypothetical protein n=1 Tax=Peribacillus sp. NPDC096540 TaxID=3390612 RepID=UPI003D092E9E
MEYDRGLGEFCSSFSLFIVVHLLNISESYLQFKLFNFIHEGCNGYNNIQNIDNIPNARKGGVLQWYLWKPFHLLRLFYSEILLLQTALFQAQKKDLKAIGFNKGFPDS